MSWAGVWCRLLGHVYEYGPDAAGVRGPVCVRCGYAP